MVHAAMFDAVNRLGGAYVSYRPHTNPPAGASAEAALAAAANSVLRYGFPQFTPRFDAELLAQLFAIPDGPEETAGVAWGRQIGQDFLRERDFDGANVGLDYRPSSGPGRWQPTPPLFASALLPQWPGVTPFTLSRADQFRPSPPPTLSSAEWAEQCNEVKALGARNSAVRTTEQTEIAWFWADGAGTETPPGHWNEVARQFAEAKNLALLESARLFALLNLALADAAIVAWDAKYAYDWWRPITAIRAADSDGNPATEPDPSWTPLIATPPFPEHISGHSTFSAAAATVLAAINGSDRFTFTLRADGLFGVTRSFNRFSDAAEEAGGSRIYGGIHFQAANVEGQKAGRSLGDYVVRNYLLPLGSLALSYQVTGHTLTLAWPAGARLESCDALTGRPWRPEAGHGLLTLPMNEPKRFFRLAQ
ncbi:MAG: vanadium-dependent haloperoxidase [Verrucomicrobia bacterium]|nr:vanadium-dependent haloperoxidase [Verrucomicrobiota bacterium]